LKEFAAQLSNKDKVQLAPFLDADTLQPLPLASAPNFFASVARRQSGREGLGKTYFEALRAQSEILDIIPAIEGYKGSGIFRTSVGLMLQVRLLHHFAFRIS